MGLTGFGAKKKTGDNSDSDGSGNKTTNKTTDRTADRAGLVGLRLRVWNCAVVCYLAVVILLLTLNPFQFQAFVPSEFWVWRVGLEDFLQNILLFFPLGVVLQHTFRRTPLEVMLCGLLLSLSVEVCQLFIVIRTSNFVDLTSNASGALLGGLFYHKVLGHQAFSEQAFSEPVSSRPQSTQSPLFTFGISFACMLLPLCWVEAMQAVGEPTYAWLILPGAIAGLSVLSGALATTIARSWQRLIVMGVWAIAALAPIFPLTPSLGIAFLISALMIAQVLSTARREIFRMSIVALLGVGLGMSLTVNGVWLLNANDWTWSIPIHLRWIEVGMSAIALLSSCLWASGLWANGLWASGLTGSPSKPQTEPCQTDTSSKRLN